MSRHLERLLEIDNLIRGREKQTSVSLASTLEVSDRTIRNDLDFLRDRFFAPLKYSKTKGWYYTDHNWRLPTISLSKGELFALTLGARMLSAYAGSGYEQELRSSIERLSERLPENTWVDLQQLADEKVIFRSGAEMINLDPNIWQLLLKACRNENKVWMLYYVASRNADSERIIDPYILYIHRATNPYLIGFCHKRLEYRWFRVDRIREIKILDETFVKKADFDAQAYLKQIFQYEVGGKPVTVKIRFNKHTAPFIRERRWHETQTIEEHDDGSLTLSMFTSGLNDLKRWILSYGSGAIALEPPELVELLRDEIQQMNNY
ncbi:WYL domain-containing protein [Cyanobacterium aponinum AL20118]|uniref:WYL domain-containing protein n=1 Tax=Cyanobacterium aponinum AL20115 TaxID=3090662 RepID=A0AAF0ZDX0_9CHRO|nr:WYL domain-containing protein [Cyanobacterium aponinum]WPF87559.1 WYL domain-containing protein [Cyanobacterium aponinum AL20115]